MFKNQVVVVPFLPMPLHGTDDPVLVRRILDFSLYLDSLGTTGLESYNSLLRDTIKAHILENPFLVDHLSAGAALPVSSLSHEQRLFTLSSWVSLPASLPILPREDEARMVHLLLSGISSKFELRLDVNPGVDRSLSTPSEARSETVALILGGSNAAKLSASMAKSGFRTTTITSPGWAISNSSVSTILPSITEQCADLSSEVPAIFYMLDNSCFKNADVDGELSAIKKLEDGKYHVVGELVVTPEVSMGAVVSNIMKMVQACGNRRIYIITPLPRYLNASCCQDESHCTHLKEGGGAGLRICCNLHRIIIFLKNQFREHHACVVVNTGDVLSGTINAAPTDVLAATASWGAVHGPDSAYDLMAEDLLHRIQTAGRLKRPREDAARSLADGDQRSRGFSFSDGVMTRPRVSGGGANRFGERSASFPSNRGRGGTSTSYY